MKSVFVCTEKLYDIYLDHPVITTDSRNVPEGSLFFALKGERFDGNQYAFQALKQGAAFAIVDDPDLKNFPSKKDDRTTGEISSFSGLDKGNQLRTRLLLVPDVLKTLQQLAIHHRRQLDLPVIAITGSNGKTTTKELIHAVLRKKYRTTATEGNFNNHIGVPLTLLRISPETEIAIVEMGANQPGEIAFLCELANPTHGLITNIGKAHLEGFGSLEGVIQTKTELYQYLLQHEGTIFLNTGDPLLVSHCHTEKSIDYCLLEPTLATENETGKSKNAMASLTRPIQGTTGKIHPGLQPVSMELFFSCGHTGKVQSKLFGSYNAINILAAACVGNHFKVPEPQIANALQSYTPSNNRSEIRKTNHNLLILDAYNANPTSMAASVTSFAQAYPANNVVILGDMLELGEAAETEHRKILELISNLNINRIFLVGPIFSRVNPDKQIFTFEQASDAARWFAQNPPHEQNILIKGSRGIQLEQLIPHL